MSGIVADEEIEKWVHESDQIIEKASFYFGEKIRLEELRKTLKSNLMKECEEIELNRSKKPPAAAIQERYAYSHPNYIELVDKLGTANRNWFYYQQKVKVFEMKYNIWRSQQATLRGQRDLYNG